MNRKLHITIFVIANFTINLNIYAQIPDTAYKPNDTSYSKDKVDVNQGNSIRTKRSDDVLSNAKTDTTIETVHVGHSNYDAAEINAAIRDGIVLSGSDEDIDNEMATYETEKLYKHIAFGILIIVLGSALYFLLRVGKNKWSKEDFEILESEPNHPSKINKSIYPIGSGNCTSRGSDRHIWYYSDFIDDIPYTRTCSYCHSVERKLMTKNAWQKPAI